MATADRPLCALSPLRDLPLTVRLSHSWWFEKPLDVNVPLVLHLCPYMTLKYLFSMYLAMPLLSDIFPPPSGISALSNNPVSFSV